MQEQHYHSRDIQPPKIFQRMRVKLIVNRRSSKHNQPSIDCQVQRVSISSNRLRSFYNGTPPRCIFYIYICTVIKPHSIYRAREGCNTKAPTNVKDPKIVETLATIPPSKHHNLVPNHALRMAEPRARAFRRTRNLMPRPTFLFPKSKCP